MHACNPWKGSRGFWPYDLAWRQVPAAKYIELAMHLDAYKVHQHLGMDRVVNDQFRQKREKGRNRDMQQTKSTKKERKVALCMIIKIIISEA